MTNLIVFRTHKIGITNIVPAMIMTSIKQGLDTCQTSLVNSRYVNIALGDFALNFPVDDPTVDLRSTVWESDARIVQYLNDYVTKSCEQQKALGVGTHLIENLEYIKHKFPFAQIGGSHYSQDSYKFLLWAMADQHVFMLKNNLLTPTQHDIELLDAMDNNKLVEHYADQFDKINLIPMSTTAFGHSIDFADLFDKDKTMNFLKDLDLVVSDEVESMYLTWAESYRPHRF